MAIWFEISLPKWRKSSPYMGNTAIHHFHYPSTRALRSPHFRVNLLAIVDEAPRSSAGTYRDVAGLSPTHPK